MMTASQFYVMARRLEDAYAAQMRSLCKETGVAQTAMDILLFLHNNPGYDTARDICTYRQLKPALVSLYIENLVQLGFLAREGVPEDRRKCRLVLTGGGRARGGKGAGASGGVHRAHAGGAVARGAGGGAALPERHHGKHSKHQRERICLICKPEIRRFWARSRSAGC